MEEQNSDLRDVMRTRIYIILGLLAVIGIFTGVFQLVSESQAGPIRSTLPFLAYLGMGAVMILIYSLNMERQDITFYYLGNMAYYGIFLYLVMQLTSWTLLNNCQSGVFQAAGAKTLTFTQEILCYFGLGQLLSRYVFLLMLVYFALFLAWWVYMQKEHVHF